MFIPMGNQVAAMASIWNTRAPSDSVFTEERFEGLELEKALEVITAHLS